MLVKQFLKLYRETRRGQTPLSPDVCPRLVSRRDVIKYGAFGLASTSFLANAYAAPKGLSHPIVILGGGAAGLSAAYALAKAGIRSELFEAKPTLGGRILTQTAFNAEGMYAELGGEVLNSQDVHVLRLAKELDLEIFDVRSKDQSLESELYFFKGQTYTNRDVLKAMASLGPLIDGDRASILQGGLPVVPTYKQTLGAEKFDRMSLSEYLESLRRRGGETWLVDALDTAFRGEYGRNCDEQSALNLLVLISTDQKKFEIFGASDEAKRVRGGNQVFTAALAKAASPMTNIHLQHRLVAIKDRQTHLLLSFLHMGKIKDVKASRAICTLPFSTLRQVSGIESLDLSVVKKKAIQELGYGHAAKLLLGFKQRAWLKPFANLGGCEGNLFTDLPARRFWDSTNQQKGSSGILTNFLSAQEGENFQLKFVERACQNLATILPSMRNQFDGRYATHAWAKDEFSLGCYTCALPGQYTQLFGSSAEDELGGRLLFAGEHCSLDWQGFIEGAVTTGLEAAQKIIS